MLVYYGHTDAFIIYYFKYVKYFYLLLYDYEEKEMLFVNCYYIYGIGQY